MSSEPTPDAGAPRTNAASGTGCATALLVCASAASLLLAFLGWGFGRYDDGSLTAQGIGFMIVFGVAGAAGLAIACRLVIRSW